VALLAGPRLQGGLREVDQVSVTEFVEEWAPRIGEQASRLQIWASRFIVFAVLAVSAWILALAVGLATHSVVLHVIGLVLLVTDVCLLALGVVLMHESFKAMSRFLGVKVQFLNAPRLHADAFRRWCQRNGVEAS
jgi:hypothetical protein